MNSILRLLFLSVAASTSTTLHAEPIDALTGTYTGIIVREHKLARLNTTPERAVKFKQSTRVAGFGFVPLGNDRTVIRLIVPSRNLKDQADDHEILIDFQADPPTVQVLTGLSTVSIGFPTVTVSGKTVIVETALTFTDGSIRSEDNCKIKITRTRPEPESQAMLTDQL